jgi:hypothetical protein
MAPDCIKVDLDRVSRHSITVKVKANDDSFWWFTGIYGPQADVEKVEFFEELREIRNLCLGPWLLAGDSNLILNFRDKNNANINWAMMGHFRILVNDLDLRKLLW